jgi:hypothetical protein
VGHFPPTLASRLRSPFVVGEGGSTRSPSAVNSFVVAGFFFLLPSGALAGPFVSGRRVLLASPSPSTLLKSSMTFSAVCSASCGALRQREASSTRFPVTVNSFEVFDDVSCCLRRLLRGASSAGGVFYSSHSGRQYSSQGRHTFSARYLKTRCFWAR